MSLSRYGVEQRRKQIVLCDLQFLWLKEKCHGYQDWLLSSSREEEKATDLEIFGRNQGVLYAWRPSSNSYSVLHHAILCYGTLCGRRWLRDMAGEDDVVLDGLGYIECMEGLKMKSVFFRLSAY